MSRRLSAGDLAAIQRALQAERADRIDISDPTRRGYPASVTCIGRDSIDDRETIVVIIERAATHVPELTKLAVEYMLTQRELDAVELVQKGMSTREIAKRLGIAVNTTRRHIEHVLLKLDVHTRLALAARINGTEEVPHRRKPRSGAVSASRPLAVLPRW